MSDSIATSVSTPEVSAKRKNARIANRDFKTNNVAGYLFISPWIIAFLLFTLIPMAISLYLAFTNYDTLSSSGEYIGLGNFQRMFFEDTRYMNSVKATLKYVVASVPLRLAFSLALEPLGRAAISIVRPSCWTRLAKRGTCSSLGRSTRRWCWWSRR